MNKENDPFNPEFQEKENKALGDYIKNTESELYYDVYILADKYSTPKGDKSFLSTLHEMKDAVNDLIRKE